MTAAAVKGIDSCPIEGFDKAKVEEVLGLDTKNSNYLWFYLLDIE